MARPAAPANHLEGQASAYLRAHAHDPVDWHPWNAKTFAKAARLGKPVFLSVGYQSCHWCHVMQRESFKDHETARILNDGMIAVKVDREIRPDIDALYIAFVAASTGSAGWPMSVFVTPDAKPIFGGTYFPHVSTDPRIKSFKDVVDAVRRSWVLARERTTQTADESLAFLVDLQQSAPGEVTVDMLHDAATAIVDISDPTYGGFGGAPKFPQAPATRFLLEYHAGTGNDAALQAARDAVYGMLRGGTFDHVGGGLFRYSVDETWFAPHFEKMLYDNALLLSTLAMLYRIEPAEELAMAIRSTASFLGRDLARDKGGYFSALDAETRGVEGASYVWTYQELAEALDPDGLALAETHLGVFPDGNWIDGTNIVTRRSGRQTDARAVDDVLADMYELRSKRRAPKVIDNVIVSWNALAARGLIEAGMAIHDDTLVRAGLETVDWLVETAVWRDEVLHAIGDKSVAEIRFLEDHTDVVAALLTAADATGDGRLLKRAVRLHRATSTRFASESGLVMSSGDSTLPMVPVRQDDSPTPGGPATHAENALRIARLTHDDSFRAEVDASLRTYARTIAAAPFLAGSALAVATQHVLQDRR